MSPAEEMHIRKQKTEIDDLSQWVRKAEAEAEAEAEDKYKVWKGSPLKPCLFVKKKYASPTYSSGRKEGDIEP